MKRAGSLLMALVMICLALPITSFAAKDAKWFHKEASIWALKDNEGNDIYAEFEDHKLYIKGKGAIPSYDVLANRPWSGLDYINEVYIGKDITSIGANAFAYMSSVCRVYMYTSTFIEDSRAFDGLYNDALFYIQGMDIINAGTEKIPYTSLDSIALMVNTYADKYRFVFDNYYMLNMVKNGYNTPYYKCLAPVDVFTTASNPNYPYKDVKISVITDESALKRANVKIYNPGYNCRVALEAFIGDYNYVASYIMEATQTLKKVEKWPAPIQYTFTIPESYKLAGREFKILQIVPGVVNVLDDMDTSDDTITFMTDYPSTVYAIIYK